MLLQQFCFQPFGFLVFDDIKSPWKCICCL